MLNISFACSPHRRCERINCFNYLDCQNTPLRITYYQLNFQTNIVVPAHIFRIGPSPAYAGDNIILTIKRGNEENYFSTRKLNSYTGIVYLQRQVKDPKDFLLDVEMKLWRQGTYTTFLAKIYIFITSHAYWWIMCGAIGVYWCYHSFTFLPKMMMRIEKGRKPISSLFYYFGFLVLKTSLSLSN